MSADAPLSPNESRILVALADGAERDVAEIARDARLEHDQARSAIEGLKARGHVEQTGESIARRAVIRFSSSASSASRKRT